MRESSSALQHDLSRSGALASWRRFEEATDQADRLGCKGRAFWVYVVELANHLNLTEVDATAVWIGQTHIEPEERLQQHRDGHRADALVAADGVELRNDLFRDQPQLRTRQEADAFSDLLAETLTNSGFSVYREG